MSLVMSVHAADQDEFTYTYKGHTLNYLVLSESKRTCAVIGSTSGPVGALELPDFPVKNGIEYQGNRIKILGDKQRWRCVNDDRCREIL